MQVAATLRYARVSPQKCRLVADVIRGKSVDDALRTLTFSTTTALVDVRSTPSPPLARRLRSQATPSTW